MRTIQWFALLAFCPAFGDPAFAQPARPDLRVYSAKFVCGTQNTVPNAVPGTVVEGTYATSVNLHNPNHYPAALQFQKYVSLSMPTEKQQDPGRVSPPRTDTLPAGRSLQIDCPDIRTFFTPPLPATTFLEGYVVIEMDPAAQAPVHRNIPLDVISVVTARQAQTQVKSIHLDRVPRVLIPNTTASLSVERTIDEEGNAYAMVVVDGPDVPGTLVAGCNGRVAYQQDYKPSEVARGVKVTIEKDPGGACRISYFYPTLGLSAHERFATGPALLR